MKIRYSLISMAFIICTPLAALANIYCPGEVTCTSDSYTSCTPSGSGSYGNWQVSSHDKLQAGTYYFQIVQHVGKNPGSFSPLCGYRLNADASGPSVALSGETSYVVKTSDPGWLKYWKRDTTNGTFKCDHSFSTCIMENVSSENKTKSTRK